MSYYGWSDCGREGERDFERLHRPDYQRSRYDSDDACYFRGYDAAERRDRERREEEEAEERSRERRSRQALEEEAYNESLAEQQYWDEQS